MSEQAGYHDHDEPMPEGEEQAPPLTHAMGIVRWILLIGMCLFALTMVLTYFGATPWANSSEKSVMYHCPMHPTYVSSQPGECPICGMSLVPIEGDTTKPAVSSMGNIQMADSSTVQAKPGQYTCPMDPDVISDTPGECPKCGMDLEQVPAASTHENHEPGMVMADSMTVPGLTEVTIEPKRLQLIGVRTARVERHSMETSKRLTGYVTADETRLVHVHLRSSGWISKALIAETGASVTVGQPLLVMYSPDLFTASQEYVLAREAAKRPLSDTSVTAMRNKLVEASRYRLMFLGASAQDVAGMDSTGIAMAELIVRSPITGYVWGKYVESGQYVSSEVTLYTLADPSAVWLIADVDEQDLSSIHVGQTAVVNTESEADAEFDARVAFIYPTLSDRTRTARIRLEIVGHGQKLRPGTYASVSINDDGVDRLTIPSDALLDGGEIQYVFVVQNNTHFLPRRVKVGRRGDDRVEILEGLREGETVVASANFLIDSESRLKAAISGMGGTSANEHAGHNK